MTAKTGTAGVSTRAHLPDGLGDGDEVFYYGTDPYLRDTDFDGRFDLTEVLNGTDPRNPFN